MASKKRILITFASSDNIYTYINSMVNAVVEYNIQSIVIVKTKGFPSGRELNLSEFSSKVKDKVDELAKDENLIYYNAKAEEIRTDTKPDFRGYKRLKEILESSLIPDSITYTFLRWDVKEILNKFESQGDIIVDLTGADKRAYIDIFMACTSVGVEKIGIFELRRRIERGKEQFTLFHNLANNKDFDFVIISKDKAFLDSLELIVAKKNNRYLYFTIFILIVLGVIAFSDYFFQIKNGENKYTELILGLITLFTGIYSVIGAWGSFQWRALNRKKI